MDPERPEDIARLRTAFDYSRTQGKEFREDRLTAIRHFVGRHYGKGGTDRRVPVNLLEQAISIYLQHMVGGEPKAWVFARERSLKPAAAALKPLLDRASRGMRLMDTLMRVVQDAMFGQGVVKIGMTESELGEAQGWWHQEYFPYCDAVDADDWVQDMSVKVFEQSAFMGNRYRLPLEVAKASELFSPKVRDGLQATSKKSINQQGDTRADTLASSPSPDEDEYEPYVELWDLWLPRERVVITLAEDASGDLNNQALRVTEWDGPICGPYLRLVFETVPSNIMPLPPVALWQDLHELANKVYRKLGRQAERQKSILPIQGGDDDDANRARDANDGDAFRCNGQPPKEVRYGGPDQISFAFFMNAMNLYSRFAGNLDSLGGLSPQASTLGQEKLLAGNAGQRISYMKRCVNNFAQDIFRSLAHYAFADPQLDVLLQKPLDRNGKRGRSVSTRWNAEYPRGESWQYDIEIEPYSLDHKTPEMRLQELQGLWQTVIGPMLPLAQQQGLKVDFRAMLATIAEYSGMQELNDWLTFQAEQPVNAPPSGGKPPSTNRNYTRTNVSAPPSQGANEMEQLMALSGGNREAMQGAPQ